MSAEPRPLPCVPSSPCVGVCRLDRRGYCVGCLRSGEEIARWGAMAETERLRVMREILPARQPA